MDHTVKEFLLSKEIPNISDKYYNEVYLRYLSFSREKNYYPVSKNKFSRDIRKWGFTTTVCRDYFTGRCKRVIIMPDEVKEYILSQNKNA